MESSCPVWRPAASETETETVNTPVETGAVQTAVSPLPTMVPLAASQV